ncbi:MAG TPA: hypothetical protein VF992_00450 [Thermoplasmata archaeon]
MQMAVPRTSRVAAIVGRLKSRRKTLMLITILLFLWLALVPASFALFPNSKSSPSAVIYGSLFVLAVLTVAFFIAIARETSERIRDNPGLLGVEVTGPNSVGLLDRRARLFMWSGAITAIVFISLDLLVSVWLGPETSLASRVILEALPTGLVAGISYRLATRGRVKTRRRSELDFRIRSK